MGQAMAVMDVAGKGLAIAGKLAEGQASKVDSQISAFKLMSAAEDRKVAAEGRRVAAEAGRVRAVQTDAAYRDELNQTMQNIGAIRAAQSVGFDSPTSMALYDKAEELSSRARRTAVSNEQIGVSNELIGALSEEMGANNLQRDAATIMQKAKRARAASLIGAIPSALSFGQSAVTAFNSFK